MINTITTAQSIGVIFAALLTLMMYSFLYKDNIFYKFGEHLYVGVSVGYLVNIEWFNVINPMFIVPFFYQRNFILIFPTILGIMMLMRFVRQVSWLSRTPMAFVIGMGSGLAIPAVMNASILEQLNATIKQLLITPVSANTGLWCWVSISLWIFLVGVICVLFYLYF
ncbi:MAG: hypothetical protein NTY09_03120, partial [bacterium]|nr:hypothetical protein [bacterium]